MIQDVCPVVLKGVLFVYLLQTLGSHWNGHSMACRSLVQFSSLGNYLNEARYIMDHTYIGIMYDCNKD